MANLIESVVIVSVWWQPKSIFGLLRRKAMFDFTINVKVEHADDETANRALTQQLIERGWQQNYEEFKMVSTTQRFIAEITLENASVGKLIPVSVDQFVEILRAPKLPRVRWLEVYSRIREAEWDVQKLLHLVANAEPYSAQKLIKIIHELYQLENNERLGPNLSLAFIAGIEMQTIVDEEQGDEEVRYALYGSGTIKLPGRTRMIIVRGTNEPVENPVDGLAWERVRMLPDNPELTRRLK